MLLETGILRSISEWDLSNSVVGSRAVHCQQNKCFRSWEVFKVRGERTISELAFKGWNLNLGNGPKDLAFVFVYFFLKVQSLITN